MEHKHVDHLRSVADVGTSFPKGVMTRRERLERWAELLEHEPDKKLFSLGEIEFRPVSERGSLRADNSPLSVAYADPLLRTQGLESDRLGDAQAFFSLSEAQAHRLLCSCMNGQVIRAGTAARQLRSMANGTRRAMVSLGMASAVLAVPAVYMLF